MMQPGESAIRHERCAAGSTGCTQLFEANICGPAFTFPREIEDGICTLRDCAGPLNCTVQMKQGECGIFYKRLS
jgi:hypothetical protein